jgi:hypothetical protein
LKKVNLANVRSGIAAMVVVAVLMTTGAVSPAYPSRDAPRITIAVMPAGTTPAELAGIQGMGVGLMSAGIGDVPAAQTYLDVGQGARIAPGLYEVPLPRVRARSGDMGSATGIGKRTWARIRDRAEGAPADLVPGLLGSTLEDGGARIGARVRDPAVAMVVDERGLAPRARGGAPRGSPRVELIGADVRRLARLARRMGDRDLLIAIERPPPAEGQALAIGMAGGGPAGTLTSDSTRMRGYVLSTDIAPTVLARLGLPVPTEMSGEPIRAAGDADPASLGRLSSRLAAIGPRRGPVVGGCLLIWAALSALAGILLGRRGLRAALIVLAVAIAYLPAMLLLGAALEPSELAERLIVGIGSPALALGTRRLAPPLGALAIAGAVSVSGYAVDVVAGSHLTALSLAGPNPFGGVRFYGIGNELEATVAALVPIATGAGLATWRRSATRRAAALAFAIATVVALVAFAPGRFGADVGAAIGLSVGAAVAAGVCLGAGRRGLALLLVVPVVALAALFAADLASGGNAHLTRTVLSAGGFDQLADVVERRLELSVDSFARYGRTPILWLALAALAIGAIEWRRIESWFGERRWAWAGWLGAVAATIAGTLVNDSGALLLIVGTAIAAATVGLAWATLESPRDDAIPRNRDGPVL